MRIEDRIWGKSDINEEILEELINSPSLERLKKISQFGLPFKYYPLKQFTRFEHSLGVMILLRKMGASLEEQAAGLTHDISHSAFSHLVDWVIGDRKREDYQDRNHKKFFKESEIYSTLKNYGFNPEDISNHKRYGLLEQPAPSLCADRIDYAMREFKDWANPEIVEFCSSELRNVEGRIVFKSKSSAKEFSYGYMKLQREHWGGAEWMLRWQIFSEALSYALKKKIINRNEFDEDDSFILKRLEQSKDEYISHRLRILKGRLRYEIESIENSHILKAGRRYKLHKKFRYIDPCYINGGNLTTLSHGDGNYRLFIEKERMKNTAGITIFLMQ